jgi:ArsR family transcriptional regulator, arsenate/arsenite/antimonite-responsive transcriptional repressor
MKSGRRAQSGRLYIDVHRYNRDVIRQDPDVRFLQAIADPVRLSIVRQLAGARRAICACDFTECCTVSQPTVSHHLRVLREAGIVTSQRRGTYVYYELAPDFARRWTAVGASLSGLVRIA